MASFFSRTFGSLTNRYYFRNFIIGAIYCALLIFLLWGSKSSNKYIFMFLAVLNTFLFPYARFVWDSIVDFILGDNHFILGGNVLLFSMFLKLIILLFIWYFAIIIAPIGLLYLFFASKNNQ